MVVYNKRDNNKIQPFHPKIPVKISPLQTLQISISGIRWKYWDRVWKIDPIFEQDNINDRLGFFHVLMAVGIWPMILTMISDAWREKLPVTRDVEDGLYSKFAYIFTKVYIFSFSCFISFRIYFSNFRQFMAYRPQAAFLWPTSSLVTFQGDFILISIFSHTLQVSSLFHY